MRISDWSSDGALPISSCRLPAADRNGRGQVHWRDWREICSPVPVRLPYAASQVCQKGPETPKEAAPATVAGPPPGCRPRAEARSEEHTSELQSLLRNSYAVFCLQKKKYNTTIQ